MFFRHTLDPARLTLRPPHPDDTAALVQLTAEASYRFSVLADGELRQLLQRPVGAVLTHQERPVATLLGGLSLEPVLWIRALAIDRQLRPAQAFPRLLVLTEHQGNAAGYTQLACLSDPWSAGWLRPALREMNFALGDYVIGYEKHGWTIPYAGDPAVQLRRPTANDLLILAAVDKAAFGAQWGKAPPLLEGALYESALMLLAELGGVPVGYACATRHQGGKLLHLMRLAVVPSYQGRGIGARLLAAVVEFCRAQSIELLSLNTQESNMASRRLYERFGFQQTGERQLVFVKRTEPAPNVTAE